MIGMTMQERIDELHDAREHLEQAITLIEGAVKGTPRSIQAAAYIIPHLQAWIEGEHTSIENLIADLENMSQCSECGRWTEAGMEVCDICYCEHELVEEENEARQG